MRLPLCCAALLLATGCSTITPADGQWAWTWDTPRPATVLSARALELQAQRNAIRTSISGERDLMARQQLYADLHQVGRELSPLERGAR